MSNRCFLVLALTLACAGPDLASARPVAAGVEDEVTRLVLAGEILPFDAIRDRVMSQVHGDYIGVDFDSDSRTYRLRFLSNGTVINVDVDARTGQRVRKTRSY